MTGMLLAMTMAAPLGCAPADDEGQEDQISDSSSPSASPPPEQGREQEAVADLAARLGVPSEEIEIVAVEEVIWRDGSLGCAQPDMMYTQALVDGSRITLRAEGSTYVYHAGGSTAPFLCEAPTE